MKLHLYLFLSMLLYICNAQAQGTDFIKHEYNTRGMLTKTITSCSETVYVYDGIGNLLSITSTPSATAPPPPVAPDMLTRCGAGSITIIASGGSVYRWYKPNASNNIVVVPNQSGATYTTIVSNTTFVYVTQIQNGCESPRKRVDIVVQDGLTAPTLKLGGFPVTTGTNKICTNTILSASDAPAGYTHEWKKDGVLLTQTTPAITISASGTYSVRIRNADNSCVSPISPVIIQQISNTPAQMQHTCNPSNVALVKFTIFPYNVTNQYQWFKNDVAIPNAIQESYFVPLNAPGRYYFTEKTATCISKSSEFLAPCGVTSVQTFPAGTEITLQPNPSTTSVILSIKNFPKQGTLKWIIFNTQGAEIKQGTYEKVSDDINVMIDTEQLSNGTYSFYIELGGYYKTLRLVKQ